MREEEKRWLHGAPRLQRPGLSPRRSELRLRKDEGGAEDPASARQRTRRAPKHAREKAAERAGARRTPAAPSPIPPTWLYALFSAPFPFPRREGRGARPVCVAAAAAAAAGASAVVPPAAGRGRRGRAGPHLLSTPPSSDALRHSGGESRRCTSATVTLYFEVELRRERRPGTEQKTSLGFTTPPKRLSLLIGMAETALLLDLDRDTGPAETEGRPRVGRHGSPPNPARPRPSSRPRSAPRLWATVPAFPSASEILWLCYFPSLASSPSLPHAAAWRRPCPPPASLASVSALTLSPSPSKVLSRDGW